MALYLGTIISKSFSQNNEKFIHALQQIKHYLTLQTNVLIKESQSILFIYSTRDLNQNSRSFKNQFCIPKNLKYFFSQNQKIFISDQNDLMFLDICYECLLILKEYSPKNIDIEIQITQNFISSEWNLEDFVQNLQKEKKQEFIRRINSSLKSIILENSNNLTQFDISNILFFTQNYYTLKNKYIALKYLATNQDLPLQQFIGICPEQIQFLKQMSNEENFKHFIHSITEKIQLAVEMRREINQKNQSNLSYSKLKNMEIQKQFRPINKSQITRRPLQNSNISQRINIMKNSQQKDQIKDKNATNHQKISIKSLLFQLKQSKSIKRLSMLINIAAVTKVQDQKYQIKLDKKVKQICQEYLKNKYQNQINLIGSKQIQQFYKSLQKYFSLKGKFIFSSLQVSLQDQKQKLLGGIRKKILYEHSNFLQQI